MRQSRRDGRRSGRGALLLEALLALAVFVSAGLAILTCVERAVSSLAMVRDLRRGADLARSALAQMEAGIAEPETLNGPVPPWTEDDEGFDDAPPEPTGWELSVTTTPSPFDGLTLVTVTALRSEQTGIGRADGAISYTLRQLVRLSARSEDGVGEDGDLLEAAREGARRRPSNARGEVRP